MINVSVAAKSLSGHLRIECQSIMGDIARPHGKGLQEESAKRTREPPTLEPKRQLCFKLTNVRLTCRNSRAALWSSTSCSRESSLLGWLSSSDRCPSNQAKMNWCCVTRCMAHSVSGFVDCSLRYSRGFSLPPLAMAAGPLGKRKRHLNKESIQSLPITYY